MNNKRRKEIKGIIETLNNIKNKIDIYNWNDDIENMIDECSLDLFSVQMDEQDAFDNTPESLQYSERGDRMQDNLDMLDECIDCMNDLISEDEMPLETNNVLDIIDTVISNLEEIIV